MSFQKFLGYIANKLLIFEQESNALSPVCSFSSSAADVASIRVSIISVFNPPKFHLKI